MDDFVNAKLWKIDYEVATVNCKKMRKTPEDGDGLRHLQFIELISTLTVAGLAARA